MTDAPGWVTAAECADSALAQMIAGQLAAAGIPVRFETPVVMPGLEPGAAVLVPAALGHRARWVLAQGQVSESDLIDLATGTLPDAGDN